MTGAAAGEDDVDFDFLVSYNNSSYMALANAAQEKSVLCPPPSPARGLCLQVCVWCSTCGGQRVVTRDAAGGCGGNVD